MGYTRRVRRGGAGFLNTIGEAIGLKKKSPFTGPLVTKNEQSLEKKIKQLEEGIPAVKRLGNFEGFNTTEAIKAMERELAALKKQVATLRGENTMTYMNNPGYAPSGGRRKTKKMTHKRRHKRRYH